LRAFFFDKGESPTRSDRHPIVAESFEEGANISEAARRNGVARGLLDLKVVLAAQPVDFASRCTRCRRW